MLDRWHASSGWAVSLRCLLWAAALRRSACQTASTPSNLLTGGGAQVSSQCRISFIAMMNDPNWMFMNRTMMRWCRIKVENKMSICCSNAEFAKGTADSCSDCIADCVHVKMENMCNKYFGKACTLKRKPFRASNISMEIMETFCVPKDCDNSNDLKSNALITWYDWAYRNRRVDAYWLVDYTDCEDISCPKPTVMIILIVLAFIVLVICAIPLGMFLFKAPKERGRVLQGTDTDDQYYESPVETMMPLANTQGTGYTG